MSYLIYYLVNGEYVEKYKINIDEEELKKIKLESIYKCGKKSKVSYNSTRFFKNNIYYTDFKQTEMGWREYNDGPDERLYNYSYIEYEPTYLSKLIDNIISSRSKGSLKELFQMDLSKEFCGFQKEINELLNKASNINDIDYKNKINVLNKLKTIYEKQEFNNDRQDISIYYKKAFLCFSYELIDKISLEECNKVINFINGIPFTNDKDCDLILKMKEKF